jgi:hypothetical protein
LVDQQESPEGEGGTDDLVETVCHVSGTPSVSFGLPETSLNISEVSLSCLDIDLVEGSIDGIGFHVSLALPIGLEGRMEILANGISTGIPEAYLLGEVEAEGIIGKGVAGVEEGEHVGVVHAGVQLVLGPGDDGDI